VIFAGYVLYEATPPLGRTLMLILGGFGAMLAALILILLRHVRAPAPNSDRQA
jgi:hypothetical protein